MSDDLLDANSNSRKVEMIKLSTRTRYGVRLMLDLAQKHGSGPVLLRDIAKEEDLSEKYLSLIVMPLRASGLLKALRGASGGYTLSREPAEITLREIVESLEGKIFLVDCDPDPKSCTRSCACATRDVWQIVASKITGELEAITLADLARLSREKSIGSSDYAI
jgi:Rrf2 family transcriptional regulator, cysteine metabolism repressor